MTKHLTLALALVATFVAPTLAEASAKRPVAHRAHPAPRHPVTSIGCQIPSGEFVETDGGGPSI